MYALPAPSTATQKVGEAHDASTNVRSASTTTGDDHVAVVPLKTAEFELIPQYAGATATHTVLTQDTSDITVVGAGATLVQDTPL